LTKEKMLTGRKVKLLGIMSGTSLDGIDIALVEMEENNFQEYELKAFYSFPMPEGLGKKILKASSPETGDVSLICELNFALGHLYAECVRTLLEKEGLKPEEIDLIGCHGQTIYHLPRHEVPSTLQIGEAGVLTEKTGITTISNFRSRDIAAGGEGAPIVPFVDHLLFGGSGKNIVLQNIGGIGNFTYLPASGDLERVIATDTGPGNMMIDTAVKILTEGRDTFDSDGKRAAKGRVNQDLLQEMMTHPFLQRNVPKSTGREDFGQPLVEKHLDRSRELGLGDDDFLATLTAFTARSIAQTCRKFVLERDLMVDEFIVSGGGSFNPTLMAMLQRELGEIPCRSYQELGHNSEAKEAVAMAILAYCSFEKVANNVPGATGAKSRVIMGDITPGRVWP